MELKAGDRVVCLDRGRGVILAIEKRRTAFGEDCDYARVEFDKTGRRTLLSLVSLYPEKERTELQGGEAVEVRR